MNERRNSSHAYRDSINCQAEFYLFLALGDYETALAMTADGEKFFKDQRAKDVHNLLQRRYDTIRGAH